MSKLSGQRAETKVGAGTAGIREEGQTWGPGKQRGKGGREQVPRNFLQGLAESPAAHLWGPPKTLGSSLLCPLRLSSFAKVSISCDSGLQADLSAPSGQLSFLRGAVHQVSPLNLPPHPGVPGRLPGCR